MLYPYFQARRGNDFWKGVGSLPSNADRTGIALVYLQRAARERNVFECHVLLATCLEALVGPEDQQDLSRRVSSRTALLARVNEPDLGDVFEHVRGLYDLRSRILHTGTVLGDDARRIRNRMMPPLVQPAGPIDGQYFAAPRYVSLEVARRALLGAVRIELSQGSSFDPERLDRPMIDQTARRAVAALTRQRGQAPIRDWVDTALSSDWVRPWDLHLDTL
jgi:hypothetical protein